MTYSFCFSMPYGVLVTIGGLIGYFKKGSQMSLFMGFLFGGLQMALGYMALQKYHSRKGDEKEILAGLVVALLLTLVMGKRAVDSGKFMPAGMVAALSLLMSLFYTYRYYNPLPLKKVQ